MAPSGQVPVLTPAVGGRSAGSCRAASADAGAVKRTRAAPASRHARDAFVSMQVIEHSPFPAADSRETLFLVRGYSAVNPSMAGTIATPGVKFHSLRLRRNFVDHPKTARAAQHGGRSEERRVGKECRSRWSTNREK